MSTPARRGSGIDPQTGAWSPSFDGQRPPFAEGNTAAMRSGARCRRVYGPLAEQIMQQMLADPALPPWLSHPLLAGTLRQYCEAQAKEELLTDAADVTGEPPWDVRAWDRAVSRQETLRGKLGLQLADQLNAPPEALWRQAARECGGAEWMAIRHREVWQSMKPGYDQFVQPGTRHAASQPALVPLLEKPRRRHR